MPNISSRKLKYPFLNQRLEEIKNPMSPNGHMGSISSYERYIGEASAQLNFKFATVVQRLLLVK